MWNTQDLPVFSKMLARSPLLRLGIETFSQPAQPVTRKYPGGNVRHSIHAEETFRPIVRVGINTLSQLLTFRKLDTQTTLSNRP